MARLIQDAEKVDSSFKAQRDNAGNLVMSFSDIVTAIDLIQQKQGIAGTTAKEAATTIEGAFNMTKAAWENLVAGFANPDADLGALMDNLIVSIVGDQEGTGLLNRLIPAVERALQGIGQFVQKAAPIISQYLPGLMSALLPGLLSAATSLVIGLVKALPSLITIVIQQIPSIVGQIKTALIEAAPALIEGGKNLMKSIYDGLTQEFPQLTPILDGLGKIFETAFNAIGTVIDFFKKNFETIKTVAVAVGGAIAGIGLVGIIGGIAGAIGTVVGAIGGLISALSMIKSFAGLVSVITTLAGGPLVLIPALIGAIVAAVIYLWNTSETFRNFVLGLWAKIQEIVAGAGEVLSNLAAAFSAIGQDIINSVTNAWNTIKSTVSGAISAVKTTISNGFEAVKKTILNVWNTITSFLSSTFNKIKTTVSTTWNNIKSTIGGAVENIKTKITDGFEAAKEKVSSIFGDIHDKIKDKMDAAKELVESAVKRIKDLFPLKLGKIFSGVKLPHFKIDGGEIPWGIGGAGRKPSVDIEWYKKAYSNPYLFTEPTVLSGIGFGDGAGAEMVYGHENLMKDIRQAVYEVIGAGSGFTQNITINSPTPLNPSEIARQTRNQTRGMILRMRTT